MKGDDAAALPEFNLLQAFKGADLHVSFPLF